LNPRALAETREEAMSTRRVGMAFVAGVAVAGLGSARAAVAEAERALGMAREPSERKRAEELLAWLRQAPTP
jgi:hypothetical protein